MSCAILPTRLVPLAVFYGLRRQVANALRGSLVLLGAAAPAPPSPEALAALLAPHWDRLAANAAPAQRPLGWSMVLLPLLPSRWPPAGPGQVTYYAYAYRLTPSIADGVRVAAPWASVSYPTGDTPQVALLSSSLAEIGVQGVRPMAAGEWTPSPADPALAGRLLALSALPDGDAAASLRQSYCGWKRLNGVIARNVAPRHGEFFAWLGC